MGKMQKAKGNRHQNYVNRRLQSELGEFVVTNPNQTGQDAGRDHLTRLPFCVQSSHAKRIDVWKKLQEALDSAREGELSLAILRKDYQKIVVVMTLDEWLLLAKAALRNERRYDGRI